MILLKNKRFIVPVVALFSVFCVSGYASAQLRSLDAGAVLQNFLNNQRYAEMERSLINPGINNSDEPVITFQSTAVQMLTPEERKALDDVQQAFKDAKYQDVIAIANNTIKNNSDLTEMYLYRGGANYYLENYSLALDDADKYLAENPKDVKGLLLRSAVSLLLNNYKQSINDCEAVLKMEENAKAYGLCGFGYAVNEEKYSKAMKYANKALRLDPQSEGAMLIKGIVYISEGKATEALEQVNNIIGSNPINAYAYTVKGYAEFQQNDYLKAQESANISTKIDPDNPYNYVLMGKIYKANKDNLKSVDQFKKARDLFYQSGNMLKAREVEKLINETYSN